jgi:RNA polymerase sigma-70 factor, ECF subfamily
MAAGDPHALQALSSRYARMLTALAWRFLGDEAEAEEMVAEVLWEAWSESNSFDPARGSVSAWLLALARRRAISRLRAKSVPHGDSQPEPLVHEAHDPSLEAYEAERARVVRSAVARMDSKQRTVLELAYFSDLSQAQLAHRLGIAPEAVRSAIRAAMIKLRHLLEVPQK